MKAFAGKHNRQSAIDEIKQAVLNELNLTQDNPDADIAAATAYGEDHMLERKRKDSTSYMEEIEEIFNLLNARLEEAEETEELDLDLDAPEEDSSLNLDLDAQSDEASIDADSSGIPDLETGGNNASIYDHLAAAYEEAETLGDQKLINQIANTITYFNKSHILKRG